MYRTHVIELHVPRRWKWSVISKSDCRVYAKDSLGAPMRILEFSPSSVFALSRQRLNDFGIVYWEFFVLQALRPEEKGARIPGVTPGARILFHVSTKKSARIASRSFSLMSELGLSIDEHIDFVSELERPIRAGFFPKRAIETYAASLTSRGAI